MTGNTVEDIQITFRAEGSEVVIGWGAHIAFGSESGDIDWGFISISAVPTLKDNVPAGFKMEILPTPNYVWVCANMANPSLENRSVRKAIQMAIDRKAIIDGAFFGVVEPSYGLAAKGRPGHIDKPAVGYDVDAARTAGGAP